MLRIYVIEEKLTQHWLRWFGYVQRRPPEAPVRSGLLKRVDNVKRDRGRSKLTWKEAVGGGGEKRSQGVECSQTSSF
jgi:hypothetical protein